MSIVHSGTLGSFLFKFCLEHPQDSSAKFNKSNLSLGSFFTGEKNFKSKLEQSFIIDQQNAKQLEKFQIQVAILKEKQRKERTYLKKLRKLYDEKIQQFKQLQKITDLALDDKSKQIDFLTIQNESLKEQVIELQTTKVQKQKLQQINENLTQKCSELEQKMNALQKQYAKLQSQFVEQSQLLREGIKKQEELMSSETDTQIFSQSQVSKIDERTQEMLKQQNQQIIQCNFRLGQLNRIFDKNSKQNNLTAHRKASDSLESDVLSTSQHILFLRRSNDFIEKSHQISKTFVSYTQLLKQLEQIQEKNTYLTLKYEELQKQEKQYETKIQQFNKTIKNLTKKVQLYEDLQKTNNQQELSNKKQQRQNFNYFTQKLLQLLQEKMSKEKSSLYVYIIELSKKICERIQKSFNDQVQNIQRKQQHRMSKQYFDAIYEDVQITLFKINEYLRQKDQSYKKILSHMKKASQIYKGDQHQEVDKDQFTVSSPQRFNFAAEHKRQPSQSSAQSFKKSIVLEEDLGEAINMNQEHEDKLKEEALEISINEMKYSPEDNPLSQSKQQSEESATIKDSLSESSFAKSKISSMSQAQQNEHYNSKMKNDKLKAKLSKRKKKN